MKTILLIFLLSFFFEAKSLPFEDGFTYTVIDSSVSYNYWGISCLNNDDCLFLARRGVNGAIIYKTLDGGISTRIVYEDTATRKDGHYNYIPDYDARNIYYFNSGIALIVSYPGVVLKSTDFGETWKKYTNQFGFYILHSEVADEYNAFAITETTPKAEGNFYCSGDGCETWSLFPMPDTIREAGYPISVTIQADKILTVGFIEKGHNGTNAIWCFYKTDFEGKKWEKLNTPNFVDEIFFLNDSEWVARGVVLGNDGQRDTVLVYKTINSGMTWDITFRSQSPFQRSSVLEFSKSLNIGYILGPKNLIIKTKDKGSNWYFIRDSLSKLGATSNVTGICIPSDNILYYTTTMVGRIVKYAAEAASVNEPLAITSKLYPNPIHINNSFTINYAISKSGFIRQYICDLGGRELIESYKGYLESGQYTSTYNLPESLSSGTYWFVTEMNGICQIKMLSVVN